MFRILLSKELAETVPNLGQNGRMTLGAGKYLAKKIQRFGGQSKRPSRMLDSSS
jgi:hypothetical protein